MIPAIGIGGAMDVAFIGKTAYVLVTMVGPDLGGNDTVGIYRVDGPHTSTVVADIGAFPLANPPGPPFFVPTGVQYALSQFRGGFLVTDGHHNRVLRVALDGEITELIAFDNIVPTGLAVRGNTIYMAEAGPVPHLPENGKVVSFGPKSPTATEVASGGGSSSTSSSAAGERSSRSHRASGRSATPRDRRRLPNTGRLVQVERDGTFADITVGLNQPTSLEFNGTTAYVVTLGGEIWEIDDVSGPPFGH